MKNLRRTLLLAAVMNGSVLYPQSLSVTYTTEVQTLFGNSLHWVNLWAINASLSSETLGGWKNGTWELTTLSVYRSSKERLLNDLMTFSNIDESSVPLSPFVLGYHHRTSRFRLFVGMRNLNEDYFVAPYSSLFINSSCGIYPTISCNYPCANYPLSAMGVVAEFHFTSDFLYCNSLYNGVARNVWSDGWKAFRVNPSRDGVMNVGEFAYHLSNERFRGDYYLGGLFHTGTVCEEDNGRRTPFNYAGWFVVEQQLFARHRQSVGVLLQGSWAPKSKNYCSHYGGAGVVLSGFLSSHRRDRLCLVTNMASFIDTREYATELSWSMPLTRSIHFQPAMQHIVTYNTSHWVGMFRVSCTIDLKKQPLNVSR